MNAMYLIYGVGAVFALFIVVVAIVVWRNRHEPSTGPGPGASGPRDVGQFRQDGF